VIAPEPFSGVKEPAVFEGKGNQFRDDRAFFLVVLNTLLYPPLVGVGDMFLNTLDAAFGLEAVQHSFSHEWQELSTFRIDLRVTIDQGGVLDFGE